MRFFEEKVHSLSVAPEPLTVWNKELKSDLFKELKSSPVAASEHLSGFFDSKRTQMHCLGVFSGSLLFVRCNCMVVVECKCCLFTGCTVLAYSSEYARLRVLFLLAWVFHYWVLSFHCVFWKACFVGTPSPCAPLLWSINTVPECFFSSIGHSVETLDRKSVV